MSRLDGHGDGAEIVGELHGIRDGLAMSTIIVAALERVLEEPSAPGLPGYDRWEG